jgi:hypothetical protein
MNLREAAQQALESMDDHMYRADTHEFYEAKEALRAALAEPEQELGQALKRAIEQINELEALNAELVEALRQVEGIINLSPHALSITRTALMKAKLEYENEDR